MELIITDRMVERAFYWIVILILAGLLIFTYLGKGSCDGGTESASAAGEETAAATADQAPEEAAPAATETAPEASSETCSDGKRNQDETDIDCGGDVCKGCIAGKACLTNDDCSIGSCISKKCTALTGNIDLLIKETPSYTGGTDVAAKITGITLSVKNGQSEALTLRADIFAKSSNGLYYLNQLGSDDDERGDTPYASFPIPRLKPGESFEKSYTADDLKGPYLFSTTGKYDAGDDFIVEVRLIDTSTGEMVENASKTVNV